MLNMIDFTARLCGYPIENSISMGELTPLKECDRCLGEGKIIPTWDEFKKWLDIKVPAPDDKRICKFMKLKHEVWDKGKEIDCIYCDC